MPLLSSRSLLNFGGSSNQVLYQKFVEQRRNVLKILMEDVLVATNKRLSRINPERVRVAGEYIVNHSDEICVTWKKCGPGFKAGSFTRIDA